MNYKQCAKALLEHDNFIILTHRNPDGDTCGSSAALCSALRRAGKTAYLYKNEQITGKHLLFTEQFFAPEDYVPEFVVAVDVASETMLPNGFEGRIDVCIDHHPSNSHYAKDWLVKGEKSSCGEIIFELVCMIADAPTAEEATWLYIALSTDTGCFQYANTNSASFKAASELLKYGADNVNVNWEYFRKVSRARLKLESMIYAGLEYYRDGLISMATVTLDMMEKAGAEEKDCDDLANLCGRAEGALLNITVREKENGVCKISMRSSAPVNSSDICAVFGGGGHALAAGCTIMGSPDKVKKMLLQVIDEVWK